MPADSGGYKAPANIQEAAASCDVTGSMVAAVNDAQMEAASVGDRLGEESMNKSFYNAYKLYHQLLKASDDRPAQADLDDLLAKLRQMAHGVEKLHIFSRNEELDDINTGDLKFLLVPALLAEVSVAVQDMAQRKQSLENAMVYWRLFAQSCEQYKLADSDDLSALERDIEDRPLDAHTRRDQKIARYKRAKSLDTMTAALFDRKKKTVGDEFSWGNGVDEETERDLILALLKRAAGEAVESLDSIRQEMPMLEMMARGVKPAPPPITHDPDAKPWIVRIKDKSELYKLYMEQVFQPDVPMPTISLAEAADFEIDQAMEAKARKEEHELWEKHEADMQWYKGDRQGAREDDEEEKATLKARSWDDWKDENPYGAGNKMANVG